jgi:hypothetical protein
VKLPIRVAIWAWDGRVDDAAAFCLPSLMQPGNLPWLVRDGYPVALDFYTVERDRARIEPLAAAMHDELRALAPDVAVTASLAVGPNGRSDADLQGVFLQAFARTVIDANARGLFAFGRRYFGDGSLRNIVTYAQKPGVTVSGVQLSVARSAFAALLARHASATGGAAVANPRLVDIALDSLAPGMLAANADHDRNASFAAGTSIRQLADDLCSLTAHAPVPLLFSFTADDLAFFERFLWKMDVFEQIWPSMLIAQNRWRVMASSDLFCLAEIDEGRGDGAFALHDGMRYNDEYDQELIHGRIHQTMLMALRRERLP